LFLADGDRFLKTPVYHVFEMYAAHQGGESVRAEFLAPSLSYDRDGQSASFWGLKGSASLRDKNLTIWRLQDSTNEKFCNAIGLTPVCGSGTECGLQLPDPRAGRRARRAGTPSAITHPSNFYRVADRFRGPAECCPPFRLCE